MRHRPILAPLALLGLACGPPPPTPTIAASGEIRPIPLAVADLSGLSSLAIGEHGALFTLPERQPVLLELTPDGAAARRSNLVGAPDGLEFESLAWLGGQRFAIGTEGGCSTGAERILLATRDGDTARVDRVLEVPLSAWGTACDEKHGIEGLCAAPDRLVASLEAASDDDDRLAPIARIDVTTGAPTLFRLRLTSTRAQNGKLSSLDCRARAGAIEVLALERHFELSRVLAFTVPHDGPGDGAPLQPRVLADLAPHTNGGARNLEGLVRLDDRRLLLIVDNHYGRVTGPNELLELTLPP